ncbi:VOC family protein [Candidatus Latescibacterota bacterium]
MIPRILQFHHLGLAVSEPERALELLGNLGYECGAQIQDPLQNVRVVLCSHLSAPDIEVISPGETEGPLHSVLKGDHERIYHMCYATRDIGGVLKELELRGHRVLCVSEPKPAVLFGNQMVSFYIVRGLGLIEILEADR